MLSSCSQTKYVPADSYLLSENEIIIKNDSTVAFSLLNKTGVTTDELNGVIKQQPNRKILIGKFHLWLYNRSNEERMERKIEKKQQKADKKNEKIKAKNERKSAKNPYYEPKQLVERKLTFGEKLRKAGEAPVILDSAKIDKTTKQMHLYLIKKGYFDNVVKDSVVLFDRKVDKKGNPVKVSKKDRQKAKVVYTVIPNEPYTINKYERVIADQNIVKVLKPLKVDSIIAAGQNFNTDGWKRSELELQSFYWNKGSTSLTKSSFTSRWIVLSVRRR